MEEEVEDAKDLARQEARIRKGKVGGQRSPGQLGREKKKDRLCEQGCGKMPDRPWESPARKQGMAGGGEDEYFVSVSNECRPGVLAQHRRRCA